MSSCFANRKSLAGLLGAASVIAGVSIKNSTWQTGKTPNLMGPGAILFLLGWIAVVLAFNMRGGDKLWEGVTQKGVLAAVGAAAIIAAVFTQQNAKKTGAKIPAYVGLLFIGGWLVMGYAAALKGNDSLAPANVDRQKAVLGGLGVASVLGAMTQVLPRERKAKITDTIGMPMFTAGWGLVALANALLSG